MKVVRVDGLKRPHDDTAHRTLLPCFFIISERLSPQKQSVKRGSNVQVALGTLPRQRQKKGAQKGARAWLRLEEGTQALPDSVSLAAQGD